jgi:hypothetical protein
MLLQQKTPEEEMERAIHGSQDALPIFESVAKGEKKNEEREINKRRFSGVHQE